MMVKGKGGCLEIWSNQVFSTRQCKSAVIDGDVIVGWAVVVLFCLFNFMSHA